MTDCLCKQAYGRLGFALLFMELNIPAYFCRQSVTNLIIIVLFSQRWNYLNINWYLMKEKMQWNDLCDAMLWSLLLYWLLKEIHVKTKAMWCILSSEVPGKTNHAMINIHMTAVFRFIKIGLSSRANMTHMKSYGNIHVNFMWNSVIHEFHWGKKFTWISYFFHVNFVHKFCLVNFTWRWILVIFTLKNMIIKCIFMWISPVVILSVYTYRYTDIELDRVYMYMLNITVLIYCSYLSRVEWLLTFRTSVQPCSTSGVCPPMTKLWRLRIWNQVFQLPEIEKFCF